MKRSNFEPIARPTIPPCDVVYHAVRRVSPLGKATWIVRRARYKNYVLRLRHHGDDGRYFASESVAKDYCAVKQKYERDVQPHIEAVAG